MSAAISIPRVYDIDTPEWAQITKYKAEQRQSTAIAFTLHNHIVHFIHLHYTTFSTICMYIVHYTTTISTIYIYTTPSHSLLYTFTLNHIIHYMHSHYTTTFSTLFHAHYTTTITIFQAQWPPSTEYYIVLH